MQTGSPPASRIATMVLFALSCLGLLLFLWLSFGGTMPFNPQGYRFQVAFPNAYNVANTADVRIAGVSVGSVVGTQADRSQNRTLVTIQMDNKYAPIRRDTHAILRTKTILGETYVQLDPGPPNTPALPDGGRLPNGNVIGAVQLYQILNTFDPSTREAFRSWQQQLSDAIGPCKVSPASTCNDQNLNNVIGNLPPFAINLTDLMQVLDIEHSSVVSLVQNGGTTFAALNRDPAALRNLITAGDTTFGTLAANNAALADVFQIFPTFLTQTRLTMADLQSFSQNADPVVKQLIPVAQQLTPTLAAVNQLSPSLRNLFTQLGPLITVSQTGLPATQRILEGLGPNTLLDQLGPVLEQLNPILGWIEGHQQLSSDFVSQGGGSVAARTNAFGFTGTGHYLRQITPQGSPVEAIFPQRPPPFRGNNYPSSLWLAQIFNAGGNFPGDWGLGSWDCKNTGGPHATKTLGTSMIAGNGACWVQPLLPGATQQYKVPPIPAATYSSR
jgi:phospholipid/cholesterol/gamma-HCH transport system substrate-binding protein